MPMRGRRLQTRSWVTSPAFHLNRSVTPGRISHMPAARITTLSAAFITLWRGMGNPTLPYAVSFRSATELTWGMGRKAVKHISAPRR